jgi:hypothetical protein
MIKVSNLSEFSSLIFDFDCNERYFRGISKHRVIERETGRKARHIWI